MTQLSLQSSFGIGEDVVVRELEGEAVLLNLASGVYFGLDRVGTRVWQLIDEHGELGRVLRAMREEYDAAPDVLERDLLRLASQLVEQGLIEPREGSAE